MSRKKPTKHAPSSPSKRVSIPARGSVYPQSLVAVQDYDGNTQYLHGEDVDNGVTMLSTFKKNGDPTGEAAHFSNFDLDGRANAARLAFNQQQHTHYGEDGRPFATRDAANKAAKRLGVTETHAVERQGQAFALVKKAASETQAAAKPAKPKAQKAKAAPVEQSVQNVPQKTSGQTVSPEAKNAPPVKEGYIRPIPLKLEGWTGSASELAALAREIYTQDLQGTSVENASLGARIAFTSEGKGEAFGSKGKMRSQARAELVKVLGELVQSAVKVSQAAPQKDRASDSKAFHTLINALEVDGRVIPVRLTIREALLVPKGQPAHKFYDIVTHEKSTGTVHGVGETSPRPASAGALDTKVADLAAVFNGSEGAASQHKAKVEKKETAEPATLSDEENAKA